MPKSRGRRPRRQKRPSRNRPGERRGVRASPEERVRAMVNIPVVRRVDEVEAGGDAVKALELINADLGRRPGTEKFWHPDRVTRLLQVLLFHSVLPGWAYSRWILAQAARSLDPSQRDRHRRAFDDTVRIIGGLSRYPGRDELDSGSLLIEEDWVHRQLLLYEYGGLEHFLDHAAGAELVGRSDRIRDWATTPIGAYELAAREPTSLTWLDLEAGSMVETDDIGSAALIATGEHAIGRLVPIDGGVMFESAPLFVPPVVAAEVATSPSDWAGALARECRQEVAPEEGISTCTTGFPMLSDVPTDVMLTVMAMQIDPNGSSGTWSEEELLAASLALLRAAMAERPEDQNLPSDLWPTVGAVLLTPSLVTRVVRSEQLDNEPGGWSRLAERLAAPAADLCRDLGSDSDGAAA